MKGKFIVFEGIDGSGTSTQIKLVTSYLFDKNKNYDVYLTREPTRNFKEIREKLKSGKDVNQNAEWYANAFLKDRKYHVNNYIIPMLEKGTHVLSDRYKHSTLAYQSTQGMDLNKLIKMHEGLIIPDITFILDCPVEDAFERRKNEGATEIFDRDKEFQEKLRKKYLDLVFYLDEKIVLICAKRHIEEVFEDIKENLDKIFD